MKEIIAQLDPATISLIMAIAYGVLSDVIGESKIKAGSVPGLFLLVLKSLAKNIPAARTKKK